MTSAYIVHSPIAPNVLRLPVSDQTVRPDPVNMLDRAPRLLEHDVAQTGVVRRSRAIGNSEIQARRVAVQEDGDVIYLTRTRGRYLRRKG